MQKVFIIADTHFGDKNIIEYEKRPFSNVQEMDMQLIENWNRVVSEDDIIFHLGDVGIYEFKELEQIIKKLNGKKILIMGNHDSHLSIKEWMECGFEEVYSYPIIYEEFIVMQHEPPQYINQSTPFYYIYGHVHGTEMYPTISKKSSCVSVERWSYEPVNLNLLKKRVNELKDIEDLTDK